MIISINIYKKKNDIKKNMAVLSRVLMFHFDSANTYISFFKKAV